MLLPNETKQGCRIILEWLSGKVRFWLTNWKGDAKVTDTVHAMLAPRADAGNDALVSSLNLALLVGILQI